MLKLIVLCLLVLTGCPTGGSDNCSSTWTCGGGSCTCEDGSACDDPATADDAAAANCRNACEVCEE
jgi:hypothetical protein